MSCHCLSKMMKHHCQIIDIKHNNDWSTWKNKFQRNLTFCSQYKEFMNTLMRNGYTKKSSDSAIEGKCWYFFCHEVYNENKPNKIRVVFDCSTECQGRSLNDELMSGPDLTNQIIGVFIRFRQEHVWSGASTRKTSKLPKPSVHQMFVHVFGGKSLPSCCNFALKQTSTDNVEEFWSTACSNP